MSKAHGLREGTERLLAQTRDTLRQVRNTRHVTALTREILKNRRERAAASRTAARSVLRG